MKRKTLQSICGAGALAIIFGFVGMVSSGTSVLVRKLNIPEVYQRHESVENNLQTLRRAQENLKDYEISNNLNNTITEIQDLKEEIEKSHEYTNYSNKIRQYKKVEDEIFLGALATAIAGFSVMTLSERLEKKIKREEEQ